METLTKTVNGFNQEDIAAVVSALQANPEMGNFELQVTNDWINGGHNRSYIQEFYVAGQKDTSRTEPFIYDNDEPPILLGANKGANPAEAMLHGLLGCMTTAMVLLAAARGIQIGKVTSRVEGDIDVKGFLGLDPDGVKGFKQIRVMFDVQGVDEAQKEELLTLAKQSPLYNSLINPMDVQVTI
ncbi:OsmC family protein [Marinigracilibium pacificum]|uniref:OsmC family protein n=1 Tax=Marinigracilibium pacificum TaxID=2729599 RepID=A0A848J4T9_9BACT|nr:OsmC family protein [Marinigracilibium pacificum]NMM50791.1 OsmC family protein [Marinigracilibium pacificum]